MPVVRMPSDTNAISTDFSDRQKTAIDDEMVDLDINELFERNNKNESRSRVGHYSEKICMYSSFTHEGCISAAGTFQIVDEVI